MKASAFVKAFSLAACLSLAGSGLAMAASFGEVTSGVRDLTGAAKDVQTMNQNKNQSQQQQPAQVQQQPAPKKQKSSNQSQKKQSRQSSPRVQGG